MDIKILGTGCANCQTPRSSSPTTPSTQLGLDATIEKVTDPGEIASWGVMRTPALVIDDEVVLSGRVPTADDLKQLLASLNLGRAWSSRPGRQRRSRTLILCPHPPSARSVRRHALGRWRG